ncbi:DegV family protein [Paenibacillus albidus]|uniref:DegV family protein n=1 Tax=Paenibacillus albidus TaxID=2041023 RepID=UPI002035FA1E|nr:DegV family protein [Paenibacillus albidus]
MKPIAWVTDSTSTLDPEFARNNHVYIVPLRLIVNQECFQENVEITADQFYAKMRQHEEVSSSQPPIGEFIELYERLKDQYEEIIAVHCSSELSGTYHTSGNQRKDREYRRQYVLLPASFKLDPAALAADVYPARSWSSVNCCAFICCCVLMKAK